MPDEGATPVLDVLANITDASINATTLDPRAQIMLRLAALVTLDAAPASYLFHLEIAGEVGLTLEDVQQVLITLAPLVGTARIVSSASKLARALGLAIAISDTLDE